MTWTPTADDDHRFLALAVEQARTLAPEHHLSGPRHDVLAGPDPFPPSLQGKDGFRNWAPRELLPQDVNRLLCTPGAEEASDEYRVRDFPQRRRPVRAVRDASPNACRRGLPVEHDLRSADRP